MWCGVSRSITTGQSSTGWASSYDSVMSTASRAWASYAGTPATGCPFPAKYESFIAISEFSGGTLEEVRLHPVELRYAAERMAHRGIPRIAPPETGQRILTRLRELSAPYGTTISIENGIGIIRP